MLVDVEPGCSGWPQLSFLADMSGRIKVKEREREHLDQRSWKRKRRVGEPGNVTIDHAFRAPVAYDLRGAIFSRSLISEHQKLAAVWMP